LSGSGSATISTSLVPRITPHALSARPPIKTKRTSASASRRRSSSTATRDTGEAQQCVTQRYPLGQVRAERAPRVVVQPTNPRGIRQWFRSDDAFCHTVMMTVARAERWC
jgi:hypothetical protein